MNHREEILWLFAYNLEECDVKEFESLSEILARDIDIELIFARLHLTAEETLLICLFLHLYAALYERNLFSDERLLRIRTGLKINDEFSGFSFQQMRTINPDMILNGQSPIYCVLNPNEVLQKWAQNVVYDALSTSRYIKKKAISNLDPKEYEHPFDRKALDSLEGTPGLETLTRKFNQYGIERLMRVQYTGSNIKITPHNFPDVHRALVAVCETIYLKKIPDLYMQLGFINAFTMGVENPIIVLTSGCTSLLTYDELLFVLGHEVGHIKSQHVLYHQMAMVLPIIGQVVGSATLGIGGLLSTGLEVALLNWSRKSEFTADRAGLLACQNTEAATTAMMKIAGAPPKYYNSLNAEHFKTQAKEFESFDTDKLDKVAKYVSVMFQEHPWTVMRAQELYSWVDRGTYESIRDRTIPQKLNSNVNIGSNRLAAGTVFCTACGQKFSENNKFCPACGNRR